MLELDDNLYKQLENILSLLNSANISVFYLFNVISSLISLIFPCFFLLFFNIPFSFDALNFFFSVEFIFDAKKLGLLTFFFPNNKTYLINNIFYYRYHYYILTKFFN